MFDTVFDWCVALLVWMAHTSGLTYKDINVWIFVIIWPVFTLVLIAIIAFQRRQLVKLRTK